MRNRMLLTIVAVLMLFGFTIFTGEPAEASNIVDITATSTPINKIGCEQLGSLSFEFDAGSTLIAGTSWFVDLPAGVTICRPVDYLIVGATDPGNAYSVDTTGGPQAAIFDDSSLSIPAALPVGSALGPITVSDGGSGTGAGTIGSVAIRVTGLVGTQRLLMEVIGNYASARIDVGAGTYFHLYITDGQPHPDNILLDSDGDGIYGEEGFADIPDNINPNPDIQLYANAEALAGNILVFDAGFDDPKYTITGDAQLAHVVAPDYSGFSPAVAYDSLTDQFLAVYSKTVGNTSQIWYLVLDGDGNAMTAPTPLFLKPTQNWNPDIAFDSVNGVFLVVWENHPTSFVSDPSEIFGMRVKVRPNGLLESRGEFTVNCDQDLHPDVPTSANQVNPAVAFDEGNGNFVVVWQDDRNAGTKVGPGIFGIRVQGCDPIDGVPCSTRCGRINDLPWELDKPIYDEIGSSLTPDIAFDISGGAFLTAWKEFPDGQQPQNIYVQAVDQFSDPLLGFPFNLTKNQAINAYVNDPSLVYDPDNQAFMVVWNNQIALLTGTFYSTYAAAVYYTPLQIPAITATSGFQVAASLTDDTSGDPAVSYNIVDQSFLVTWWNHVQHMITNRDIYGRYLDLEVGGNITTLGNQLVIANGLDIEDSGVLAPLPDVPGFLSVYESGSLGGETINWTTVTGLLDTDGDGVLDNADNCPSVANPGQEDLDGDGLGNVCDGDVDDDGSLNAADLDDDNDGLPDADEATYLSDSYNPDTDGDGLWDGDEVNIYGTQPDDLDTDNDTYNDFLEVLRDSDPLDADPNNVGSTPMWENDTFIRRITSGQLESVVASYGYKQSNSLVFADPTAFDDFEAEVTVTDINSKSANTRARLLGAFYQSGGRDIYAEIGLRHTPEGLRAYYEISSCDDSICNDWQGIAFDQSATPLNLNQPYTLNIAYDPGASPGENRFTFGLDGQEFVFDASNGLPPNNGPAAEPMRLIGTRISGSTFGPDSGGYCRALFDNVRVNDPIEGWVLYDNFTGPRIDQDNWLPANEFGWQTWEFVRRADEGYIQSAVANYNQNQSNNLGLVNPETIGGYSADVSVTGFDNNAAWTGARTIAVLYNDGTPGPGDRAGDIVVGVGLGNTGTGLSGYYQVVRCLSGDCSLPGEYEHIVYEPNFFPAEQDRLYTLGMNWNPATSQIEFNYHDYTEQGGGGILIGNLPQFVGPPLNPFRGLGTRISSIDAPGEYGYIKANFENVQVTHVLSYTDSDSDGVPDSFDAFPDDPNEWLDTDGDGVGNNTDLDDDGNGIDDATELALGWDPENPDGDGDGYMDLDDNCPADSNPGTDWYDANTDLHVGTQPDYDLDGIGDACDDDDDNDGVLDTDDNCITGYNPGVDWRDINEVLHTGTQPDYDLDGLGNVCDKDADGDRYVDWIYYEEGVIEANCNPGTADPACLAGYDCNDTVFNVAGDSVINGDCTGQFKPNKTTTIADSDGDGHADTSDNCPNDSNADQDDIDNDGLGDACDACPNDPQNDIDNDGICGDVDSCPNVVNTGNDFDGDGTDDACDLNADGDESPAVEDCNDLNPLVYLNAPEISDGLDNDCDGQVDEGLSAYSIRFELIGDDADQTLYKSWLPAPNASVTVRAIVVDHNNAPLANQPATITFAVAAVTGYPGDFTNHSQVHETPDIVEDFVANSAEFTLTANDWGGAIRIRAEANVQDANGNSFLAQGEFSLPRDIDNDGLPDAFETLKENSSLSTLDAPDGDYDGDGITNINELRGFFWGPANMEVVPGETNTIYDSWYQTEALVPHGAVAHFRTDPTRKDLFIQVKGYYFENYNGDKIIPSFYAGQADLETPADRKDIDTLPDAQFALGWAFKNAGVDAHVASLDAAAPDVDLSLLENNIDFFKVTNQLTGTYGFGTGHITKIGVRDAAWSTKGFSGIGDESAYGAGTETFQMPLDYMFKDRMWQDDTTDNQEGQLGMLDWVAPVYVEDNNDNGINDYIKKEKAYESEIYTALGNTFDGDRYTVNLGYAGDLTVFDIDNDGFVELPLADDPQNIDPEFEYTKLQVLKHTITHECGHAVGMSHTSVPQCVMYEYSIDWSRDGIFSDSAIAVMRIHNQ